MKKIIIFLSFTALAVKGFSIDVGDQARMVIAKQKLYGGQYNEALDIYNDVLKKNPNDATVLYYVGYCNFKLNKNSVAIENLNKAIETKAEIKPETYYILGRVYFSEANIEKALVEFEKFKALNNVKSSEYEDGGGDVNLYISQCNNSKKLSANPIPVKIDNLGSNINSKFDDQTPCITADGRQLVITTRRPKKKNSLVDVEGDGKYFQDIYISSWDTVNQKWNACEAVPGKVNTDAHDACTSISADGKKIYLYKNDASSSESRGGDIFVSKINNGKWKAPESIGKPVNSSYWEGGACISPDGKTLFFISERKGGFGSADIWMSNKISGKEWDEPVNLGADINSVFDEVGVFLAPDGKTLFFSSNGMGSMGSYDIFKTTLVGDKWTKPVNLGYPINTIYKDGPLVISADANTAYFASNRPGGLGETDIYSADLSNYSLLDNDGKKKSNSAFGILKGVVVDDKGKAVKACDVQILDAAGAVVSTIASNDLGEYFVTLKGGSSYTIKVVLKGYKTFEEKIEIKISKTTSTVLNKTISLVPEK